MVFIGGVHGAGKTRFCQEASNLIGLPSYSASTLISDRKGMIFPASKNIQGIDENQLFLISAIKELKETSTRFLLDGHLCLLNNLGHVVRISKSTFLELDPDGILVITESPEVIAERRLERDKVKNNLLEIKKFQDEELAYAQELAMAMNIPIAVASGENRLAEGCDFISRITGGVR